LLELAKILDVNPAFFFANERHGGLNGKAGPREARLLDSVFRSEPSVEVFRLIRAFASIESQSSREAVIKFAETKAEKHPPGGCFINKVALSRKFRMNRQTPPSVARNTRSKSWLP
jgi:hypothetical protein